MMARVQVPSHGRRSAARVERLTRSSTITQFADQLVAAIGRSELVGGDHAGQRGSCGAFVDPEHLVRAHHELGRGSRGSSPRRSEAIKDRAVSGGRAALRVEDTCRQSVRYAIMTAVTEPLTTVLPPPSALPDVLPTDRLLASGMPVRPLRDELRRIDDVRNVGSLVLTWLQPVLTIGLAVWIGHPLAYVVAFFLMGPAYVRFAILGHEAAHRLLFTDKRLNDFIGRWFVAYPGFVPFEGYRRSHFAHHKDEFGPDEPDLNLYNGYPITSASFWRKMRRDAFGKSGWKNLKGLLMALTSKTARPFAGRIVVAQIMILAMFIPVGPARIVRAPVVASLDDRVAGHEPPPRSSPSTAERRARRTVGSPLTTSSSRGWRERPLFRSTRAGTSLITSTWECRGATCPRCTPNSWRPAG